MMSSRLIFALLILLQSGFTKTFGTVLNLAEVTKIFDGDLKAKILHDIIFCGNFNNVQVSDGISENYQITVLPEDWILTSTDGLNTTAETDGNSIIIYFAPSTKENFYTIIDTISSFFAEVNMTSIKSNRRIFLVSWPVEIEDRDGDADDGNGAIESRKLRLQLEEDEFFREVVRNIRQNEEVYVLVWKKKIKKREGENSESVTGEMDSEKNETTYTYSYSVLDMIELYGIFEQVAVIQSLIIDFDDNPDVDTIMDDDINTTELMRFSARRKNFRRVRFKVVAMQDESYNAEVKVEINNVTNTVTFLSGSSYYILKDFQLMLNFRYKGVAGTGWIHPSEDKHSLTGLGKQIMDKSADICISTSTLEVYRAVFVQFLQPVLIEESFIFFLQPSITSARNIFTMPFTWSLWYNIAIAWVLLIVCGSFLVYQKQRNFRHVGTSKMFSKYKKEQEDFHTADVFVWAIGVLCQQGWCTNPMKISTRVLFLTAMVTSILLYAYYTAAFVATISAPVVPIKDISDFKRYQYQIFIDPSSPAVLIAFVGEAEGKKITEISYQYYKDEDDTIEKVLKPGSKLAGIVGADAFFGVGQVSHTTTQLCQVHQLKANGSARVRDAMIVRKGSPYKEIFGQKTIVIIERGFQKRYATEYARETQLQCTHTTAVNLELEFLECYSAFVILLLGGLLAVAFAFCERHYKHRLFRKQVLQIDLEMQIKSIITHVH